jgi:hypothetical protein
MSVIPPPIPTLPSPAAGSGRESRLLVELLLFLCMAFAAGLAASQGQSLSILVTDDSGAPLPQALVVVQDDRGQGPAPAQTGEDGRVSFELGAGEWQVDVRREGFMIYTGYVSLEAGERPELGFSSRQRTGSFWAPLRVSFSGGGSDAVFAASRKEEKEARKREEQRLKNQERAERRATRGDLARVKVPERPAQPTPSPPEKSPPENRTSPPEAESSRTIPEPAADLPGEPTVEPTAAALPEVEAEPKTIELPTPAGERALQPNPQLLRAGACQECRANEWALLATVPAAPLDSGRSGNSGRTADVCTAGTGRAFSEIADLIAQHLPADLWTFAGSLKATDGQDLLRLLEPEISDRIERLLSSLTLGAESCPVVAAVIPAGSKYIGYRYRVAEGKRESDCRSTEECLIGEARWRADPGIEKRNFGILVHSQFENSSRKNEREAELRVYFVPPAGWLPPN